MRFFRRITKHYPLYRPRYIVLEWLPDVPVNFGQFSIKGGLRIDGYKGGTDLISKNLFWFGDFAPEINLTFKRLVKPGDVVIDVGANIGTTAMQLAIITGIQGRVICFEPIPQTFANLQLNISANQMQQVECWQLALAAQNGKTIMVISDDPGLARISNEKKPTESIIEVSMTKFDDWLLENSLKTITCCKIDVEGYEMDVFKGMDKTLREKVKGIPKIQSFVFERQVSFSKIIDPVFDYLTDLGYFVFRIDRGYRSVTYVKLGSEPKANVAPTHDFLAVYPGSDSEKRIRQYLN